MIDRTNTITKLRAMMNFTKLVSTIESIIYPVVLNPACTLEPPGEHLENVDTQIQPSPIESDLMCKS